MGFLVSPGVEVNEIDLTNVIPAVSTSIGGYVGTFTSGPIGTIVNISSEKDLQATFGTPTDAHAESFLTAASFLKYGNSLKVVRVAGTGTLNAVAGPDGGASSPDLTAGELFGTLEKFEEQGTFDNEEIFFARSPGLIGNGLKVVVVYSGATSTADHAKEFDFVPGTSDFAADNGYVASDDPLGRNYGDANDEIHVLVLDKDGEYTGTRNGILEKFQGLSLIKGAKLSTGRNNYYLDVINEGSRFIFVTDNLGDFYFNNANKTIAELQAVAAGTAITTKADAEASPNTTPLLGADFIAEHNFAKGADGSFAAGDVTGAAGLGLFEDAENVDLNLLFATTLGDAAQQKLIEGTILSIAAARKDILGCGSAPIDLDTKADDSAKLAHVLAQTPTTKSNYFATTGSTAYVYNKYTDKFLHIGTQGFLAGLCANTDDVAEPWFSPAGFNRGQLLGVTRLSYNPKQVDRDSLYKAAINPITNFPGQGIVLFGDKTYTLKPSACDRINVRRLFMVLEKAIATAAKFQLFELNDEFTRAMFRNMTEPFLRDVKGRRGITDFLVVCDETNNTGEVIDTNRFVDDIYIKPARSINFITLNFIATRTGVEFSEIVGTN